MLRLNALILTAVFIFILVKPVIPYLEYMVRKDWIIEKFCINKEKPEIHCNGKCHLEKQLNKEADESDNQLPDQPRQEKKVRMEYLVAINDQETCLQAQNLLIRWYKTGYSFQFSPSIFRPPILVYSCLVKLRYYKLNINW